MMYFSPVVGGARVTQEDLSIGMTVLGMRMILVGIGSGIGERMVSDTCKIQK